MGREEAEAEGHGKRSRKSGQPWTVWAPNARKGVELVLGSPEQQACGTALRVPMRSVDGGWWCAGADELRAAGVAPGTGVDPHQMPYGFALDGGTPRPDPRGMRLQFGVHGPTTPFDPSRHEWKDTEWRGRALEGSILYEIHVGTFTDEGTLDAAAGRLDQLAALGVTTIELMPLSPFPGEHNWGYDGVCLYGVHERHGGPAALQRFVDAAHARGLSVILDVVYNHFGPDGNYLAEFGPYFSKAHHTPWGAAINLDGVDSDPVREYLIGNALQWLRDFHIDGLRIDAAHALKDDRATHLLEELSQRVDEFAATTGRSIVLIAEDDRNDTRITMPRGEGEVAGGIGMTAQWTDDIHHALHVALSGESSGYYADFAHPQALRKVFECAFFHNGSYSSFRGRRHGRPIDRFSVPGWRFVASLQTHDQIGNRRAGDRLHHQVDHGRFAAGAALLLCSPFTPMLFMGEEWAASTPWQYFTDHQDPKLAEAVRLGRTREFAAHGWGPNEVPDPQSRGTMEASRLNWAERGEPVHARMLDWYRRLIALRHGEPELGDPVLARVHFDWQAERRCGVLIRGGWRVGINLSDRVVELPVSCAARIVLAWEPDATRCTEGGTLILPPRSSAVVQC